MRHSIAWPVRVTLFRDQPQRPAFRHRDLLGDQVQPGHRLGDRVLHLDTRVHLQEEEGAAVGVDEEFDGAETAIAQPGAEGDRSVEYRGPSLGSRWGAGASSTTFWYRRWTEQSRSPRWMTRSPSPSSWTSICRAWLTKRSR
jgi:hypothetical protein